jgi:Na+-translocating ferredoxin:NAD+ oxidoreductase RnfD subunit
MKENSFLNRLQTSKILRFSLEILISIIFFSWLPLIQQILAVLVVSLVLEIIFAKNLTHNLKNKFSSEDVSKIVSNSKKGQLS